MSLVCEKSMAYCLHGVSATLTCDSICVLCGLNNEAFDYDSGCDLLTDGEFTYAYDVENRLRSVIVLETKTAFNSPTLPPSHSQTEYFWGLDLSNALQGAGGVGGLLAVSIGGQFYFPAYDANGNITKYLDESGDVVASYTYDAFGNTIAQSGPLADFFRHRFSTKYLDAETGLYYYGYRFYSPELMRWLNRDPIEEQGGENLYAFCRNNTISQYDELGLNVTLTTGNRNASWFKFGNRLFHQEICVDTWIWNPKSCCWRRTGRSCFSFAATSFGFGSPGGEWLGMESIKGPGILRGEVYETEDQGFKDTETLETTPCQDNAFLDYLLSLDEKEDTYSVLRHNCRTFSQAMMQEAKRLRGENNGGCKNDNKCN